MFFREKKTRKARVLQLVENSRNAEGKVRQRLVVSLGGCPVPDEHRKPLPSMCHITQRVILVDGAGNNGAHVRIRIGLRVGDYFLPLPPLKSASDGGPKKSLRSTSSKRIICAEGSREVYSPRCFVIVL